MILETYMKRKEIHIVIEFNEKLKFYILNFVHGKSNKLTCDFLKNTEVEWLDLLLYNVKATKKMGIVL